MKKYYVIENSGEVDFRSFYMMGMTSKLESDESIGQFGTGNKYGIASLIRENHKIVLFSGKDKITPYIKPVTFRDQTFQQICFDINSGEDYFESSMTVEMGKIGWTLEDGLREFVSNAKDEGDFSYYEDDEMFGESNTTKIYIENSKRVKGFFNSFDSFFTFNRESLHIGEEFGIYKKESNEAKCYRKGVLVHFNEKRKFCFDYDFADVEIGEERKANLYSIFANISGNINQFPVDVKKEIISCLSSNDRDEYYESDVYLDYKEPNEDWFDVIGDNIIVSVDEYAHYHDELVSYPVLILPQKWVHFLKKNEKIKTVWSILSSHSLKGWEVIKEDLDVYSLNIINDALSFLREVGYDISPKKIVVANNRDSNVMGQYIEDKYYINETVIRMGVDKTIETIIEEHFHDKSKCKDKTREFQDFIFGELCYQLKRLKSYMEIEKNQRKLISKNKKLF